MAKVTMLNMAGAEVGAIELNDDIFAITPNENAVHAVGMIFLLGLMLVITYNDIVRLFFGG